MEIGLSLGANLGDRLASLRQARRRILALANVRLLACAPVYETEPVGVAPEHRDKPFLNTMLIVESGLPLPDLAAALADIEVALGRSRADVVANAPRSMDIDVIYADELTGDRAGLILPHPRWAQRRFVVQPLADVRPALVLPDASRPVLAVLAALPPRPAAALFAREW
jgi:2-amino-4-hydroxy-6-hydroxymethyldihydropteridine diphosphokinase